MSSLDLHFLQNDDDRMSFYNWLNTNHDLESLSSLLPLSSWIYAMHELTQSNQLRHSYTLVRHAYCGENRTGKKTSDLLTGYTAIIKEFTVTSADGPRKYILLENDRLQPISSFLLKPCSQLDPRINKQILESTILSFRVQQMEWKQGGGGDGDEKQLRCAIL